VDLWKEQQLRGSRRQRKQAESYPRKAMTPKYIFTDGPNEQILSKGPEIFLDIKIKFGEA